MDFPPTIRVPRDPRARARPLLDIAAARRAAGRFELHDLLQQQNGALSGGQRRRLALALAFAATRSSSSSTSRRPGSTSSRAAARVGCDRSVLATRRHRAADDALASKRRGARTPRRHPRERRGRRRRTARACAGPRGGVPSRPRVEPHARPRARPDRRARALPRVQRWDARIPGRRLRVVRAPACRAPSECAARVVCGVRRTRRRLLPIRRLRCDRARHAVAGVAAHAAGAAGRPDRGTSRLRARLHASVGRGRRRDRARRDLGIALHRRVAPTRHRAPRRLGAVRRARPHHRLLDLAEERAPGREHPVHAARVRRRSVDRARPTYRASCARSRRTRRRGSGATCSGRRSAARRGAHPTGSLLAVYAVGFGALAAWGFARDELRHYR